MKIAFSYYPLLGRECDVLYRPLHPLSISAHRIDEKTLDRFWLPGKPAVGSISHLVRGKNRPAGIGYLHNLDVRRTEWSRRAEHLMSETSPAETEQYARMLSAHLARLESMVNAARSAMVIMYVPDSGYDFAGFVIIALVNLLLPTMVPKCAVL